MHSEFLQDPAMKRALIGAILVSCSSAPLGVFLVLRRMSLLGDIMAHAILPGVAAAFILFGMSIPAMSIGGLAAGLTVALLAGVVSRFTALREDASFAALYLIAVASGVLMISLHGTAQDLEDILFGDARLLDEQILSVMAVISALTLLALLLIYRTLVVESFDPVFLRTVRGNGGVVHAVFITLTVLNMVANYQAMGTLMSAGLMLVPAIASQFWTQHMRSMLALAVALAVSGSLLGLIMAFSWNLPSGPSIILILGGFYLFSLLFGRFGSVRARYFPFRHFSR
ncbi:metal ABC transporter permease [Chlorobium ferrooxidans]|uniref:metal ABC transporter permease n=1 Tax=Chlorobium ferrooxidans TaxID=84205 RepID=UPI00058E42AC|nr:metal ABC transporter permease [Chlorobium ferrooxidans]